jgi:hypothetical protein
MRRRIGNKLCIFTLSEHNLSATLGTMAEVLGSSTDARGALRRQLQLFTTGSSTMRHNWAALRGLLGGDAAAARKAVGNYPALLRIDVGRDVIQQRIRFYQQECGASLEQVLNSYLEFSLVHVGPRVAWAVRHRSIDSQKPLSVGVWTRPDRECMPRCGVPLEGYAKFKAAWLASDEGREWCKHEAGRAAKSIAAGGRDGD